jgi:hypothetical protein
MANIGNSVTKQGQKTRIIVTAVDAATRTIHGTFKDGGSTLVTLYEIPAAFRWPQVGEVWTVIRQNINWMLGERVNAIDEAFPVTSISGTQMRLDASEIYDMFGNKLGTVGGTSSDVFATNTPRRVTVENAVDVANTVRVTSASGTQFVSVDNWPTVQTVYVENQPSTPANVNVTNTSLAVTQDTDPWIVSGSVIADQGTSPWQIAGSVQVDNFPPVTTARNSYSTKLENSHVISTNTDSILYGIDVYSAASYEQFIMLFDSAVVPAQGAYPVCAPFPIASGTTIGISFGDLGRHFSTGITVANSLTAPTLTSGAPNCFFDGQYTHL